MHGFKCFHYSDMIMSAMASEITGVSIIYPTVCSDADQRKLRFTGLCEGNPPVNGAFPSQRASNAEMFPFDDVIMHRMTLPEREDQEFYHRHCE